MGFTKLDENILLSSIMSEDAETFKVWIALLASCKADGISPATIPYLSSVCRIPLGIVEKAIIRLSSPDKYSRSLESDGKRIERISGGFRVVNYHKYREYTLSDSPSAKAKRDYREKKRHTQDMSGQSPDTLLLSSASSSVSVSEEEKSAEKRNNTDDVNRIYSLYPTTDKNNNNRTTGKSSKDKNKIAAILKTKYPLEKAIRFYISECNRNKTYLKNFSVFLNNLPDESLLDGKIPEQELTPEQIRIKKTNWTMPPRRIEEEE